MDISQLNEKLDTEKELYLRLRVTPGASKNEIVGFMDDDETLKVNIQAPPVKGKANKELIKFFSKVFSVQQDCVSIISGQKERKKLVKITK